jgi:hypothetical protein
MQLGRGCNGFFMAPAEASPVPASTRVPVVAEQVELELTFEGQRVGYARYEPTWTEHRPNGPQCGPVCLNGEPRTLDVD